MITYTFRRRVRYRECDPMGRVYHTHYLDYFEEARTEALRSFGLAYRELEESGVIMPVTEVEMRFRGAARYDDLLAVETSFPEEPRTRVGIEYSVRRADEEEVLVTGRVELCFLDADRERPVRAPRSIRDVFERL